MNRIWKPTEPESDKFILIRDQIIYKGNPPSIILNTLNIETIDVDKIKNVFSMPYSYIRKIENQKSSKKLKFYVGSETEEEIKLESEIQKSEIFNFLRQDLVKFTYQKKTPNIFIYAKAQLFAFLILTAIYILTLHFAFELESGASYEMIRGRIGIFGLSLLIAKFGVVKVTIGYILLLALAIYSFINKIKGRSEIETLTR